MYHKGRTNIYKSSFFPSTIDMWNSLSIKIRNIQDLSVFKRSLKTTLFPLSRSDYFHTGPRLPSIWHTQLRLGHSSLKSHKFVHGLSESNQCVCGCLETTDHYFFDCPLYAAQRMELLTSIASLIASGVHYSILLHLARNYLLHVI